MKYEEIEAYIKSRDLDVMQYQISIDAMYYTEKTIIEKACEWLNMNIIDYITEGSREGISLKNQKELIEDFRKAMEE